MPYFYLSDIATADIAFQAWGKTQEKMFIAAADAVMNVMVEDLNSIARKEKRKVSLKDENIEILLFQFLQELVYYKDAEQLLLRTSKMQIKESNGNYTIEAELSGEPLDPEKHKLHVDIKAITLHQFKILQTKRGWEATVVLDI